jgi:hypothetical protein
LGRVEGATESVMNRKIIIRPEAAREVQEAFDWYEERDEGLGAEFLRAAEACLSAIRRNPFAYPLVYGQVRRALLRRFPYACFMLSVTTRLQFWLVFTLNGIR